MSTNLPMARTITAARFPRTTETMEYIEAAIRFEHWAAVPPRTIKVLDILLDDESRVIIRRDIDETTTDPFCTWSYFWEPGSADPTRGDAHWGERVGPHEVIGMIACLMLLPDYAKVAA